MREQKTNILTNQLYDLMEKVVEAENLKKALMRVEKNKGAPGIDRMQTQELRPYLKEHWKQIKESLLKGTYKPTPVRRVQILKREGGVRELGIPTVLDRFIQQAIQQILSPVFEKTFFYAFYLHIYVYSSLSFELLGSYIYLLCYFFLVLVQQ